MAKHNCLVSIGLPVYNGECFLEDALDSLLSQTYTNFELIISDNASTDRTQEIGLAYEKKDPRVRYSRNTKNIGIGLNFNRAFELSKGYYFKWASADDMCDPELLENCVEVLNNDNSVVLACAKTRFIDEKGRLLNISDPGWNLRSEEAYGRLRYVICAGHWVNPHYGLMRHSALLKTRLMPNYPGGDYRLLAELSLKGKFIEIPEYLFFRRIHAEASSQNTENPIWMIEYCRGDTSFIFLPFLNLSADYFSIIIKSNFNIYHKLSLLNLLMRRMWWKRRDCLQELIIAFKIYRS